MPVYDLKQTNLLNDYGFHPPIRAGVNGRETMSEKQKSNKPLKKFAAGGVVATIWENSGKNKDGEKYTYHTVNVDRSYKDSDDEWQKTSSFRLNDLPKVELVSREAYAFLALKGDDEE